MTAPLPRLILASASPRRADLLRSIKLPFTVAPAGWDEPPPTPEDEAHPAAYAQRLAATKARHCPVPLDENTLILAADTIVWHQGTILNKPADAAEALSMLRRLCNSRHQVFTGLSLLHGDHEYQATVATRVHFRAMPEAWLQLYAVSGEPLDKAGAYAAQGQGALLIDSIEGDYSNVVGLPLGCLAGLLARAGYPIERWWAAA